MKKGILVYDRADAEKNEWFINKMIDEGRDAGLEIRLVLTEEVTHVDECDFAIVRNRDYRMSEWLEGRGIKCFNSSYVCKIGNDKWEMYRDFAAAGIPVMYTQISKLPYPFVLKPRDGHGGENVYLVRNQDEYAEAVQDKWNKNRYIYQMAASDIGRDIRVYVVGDTILTAMERTAGDGEFRANFSLGGNAAERALTEEELTLAARVARHLQADFVGIDIIYNNGKPVVNEIEDAVGTRMVYAMTDLDPVREYVAWIARKLASDR